MQFSFFLSFIFSFSVFCALVGFPVRNKSTLSFRKKNQLEIFSTRKSHSLVVAVDRLHAFLFYENPKTTSEIEEEKNVVDVDRVNSLALRKEFFDSSFMRFSYGRFRLQIRLLLVFYCWRQQQSTEHRLEQCFPFSHFTFCKCAFSLPLHVLTLKHKTMYKQYGMRWTE